MASFFEITFVREKVFMCEKKLVRKEEEFIMAERNWLDIKNFQAGATQHAALHPPEKKVQCSPSLTPCFLCIITTQINKSLHN